MSQVVPALLGITWMSQLVGKSVAIPDNLGIVELLASERSETLSGV